MQTQAISHRSHPAHFIFSICILTAGVSGCMPEDTADERFSADEEDVAEAELPISWGGHDYLFLLATGNYDQAIANCTSMGPDYHLVTVNSSTEQSWLSSEAYSRGSSYYWWIGLNDRGYEGTWQWTSGTSSYKNFAAGQPDNSGNQDCVTLRALNGYWYDMYCTSAYRIICERDY